MKPRVLILILCHNKVQLTLACLRSLAQIEYAAADTLVIDNASSDDTALQITQQFPQVKLIHSAKNLGYTGGNNVGLRYALEREYPYVLLLNNDTEVDKDFLGQLVAICEANPDVGVAGPKIYFYDSPTVLWSAGGIIDWRHGARTAMRGLGEVDRGQYDQVKALDFVTGCAFLVRSAVLTQTGLLDDRFGMYYDETEWCVRIARAGWRIVYVPTSRVWHKIQVESQDISPHITYYMARNRLLFLRATHAALPIWLYAILVQDLRTWLSWRLRPKWRHRAAQRAAMLRAWRDFLRGHFGMAT